MRWARLELSGGFLLLAALLFYLDEQGVLLWGALACTLHELGHYAAISFLGGRVARVRLSAAGAEMVLSAAYPMGRLAQFLAALAGPGVNLVLAWFAARLALRFGEMMYCFAGLNVVLAAFNLLPAAQMDGGRALAALLEALLPEWWAVRISAVVSVCTTLGVLFAGMVLLRHGGGNLTLLVTAAWLVAAQGRTKQGARRLVLQK